jgi:hypothetical protein
VLTTDAGLAGAARFLKGNGLGWGLLSLFTQPKRGLQTGLVDIYPDRLGMVRDPNCPSHSPKTTVPLSGLLRQEVPAQFRGLPRLRDRTEGARRVLLKIGSILFAAIALLDRFPESNFRWTGVVQISF